MTTVTLTLTRAEATALEALASEGGEGLFNDAAAGAAYLGGARGVAAGQRALGKLKLAIARAPDCTETEA